MHLPVRARMKRTATGASLASAVEASPLPITIGPEQAVAHRSWCEARNRLLEQLRAGPSLTLLVGPAGTGKTLLLQHLSQSLRAAGRDVLLQPRGDKPIDVTGFGKSGGPRVVLIDEAERMTKAVLAQLARLGECAVVLAGLPDPGESRAGAFPAAAVVRLAPLPASEIEAFVSTRLRQAGLPVDRVTGPAVAALGRRSGGVPRLINMLLGSSLFLSRLDKAKHVEAAHVDKAAALRDGTATPGLAAKPGGPRPTLSVPALPRRERASFGRRCVVPAAAALAMIIAACLWLLLRQDDTLPQAAAVALPPPVHREAQAPLPAASAALPGTALPGTTLPGTALPGTALPKTALAEAALAEAAPAPTPAADPVAASLADALPLPPAPIPPPALPDDLAPEPAAPEPAASKPALLAAADPDPEFQLEPGVVPTMTVTSTERPGPASLAEPLPSDAPPRVLLRLARTDADPDPRAAALAAALRAAGFAVISPPADALPGVKPGLRYFFTEDRRTAEAVQQVAGLSAAVQTEPSRPDIQPRPGLIELTLPPDQSATKARPVSSRTGS